MTNGWNARPFEEYYTTIPKQKVQFPSITVCPAGEKLYLNNNNLKYVLQLNPIFPLVNILFPFTIRNS